MRVNKYQYLSCSALERRKYFYIWRRWQVSVNFPSARNYFQTSSCCLFQSFSTPMRTTRPAGKITFSAEYLADLYECERSRESAGQTRPSTMNSARLTDSSGIIHLVVTELRPPTSNQVDPGSSINRNDCHPRGTTQNRSNHCSSSSSSRELLFGHLFEWIFKQILEQLVERSPARLVAGIFVEPHFSV